MGCGSVTKYKRHPWPTDGATRKYVHSIEDRLQRRLDQQGARIVELKSQLVDIVEFLQKGPHASAYQLFLETKKLEGSS